MTNEVQAVQQVEPTSFLEQGNSVQDMAVRLTEMKQKLDIVQAFFKKVMLEGMDYGVIPGTNKPTLLKAGAEKLCEFYNLAITIKDKHEEADRETGYYRVAITIALVSKRTGEIVAEGIGEANTMEGRYRWRWVPENKLPNGIDKSVLHSEERSGKYGKFRMYRLENDDPWTLWNTVLKMAKKRALIDAVLSATRSSGIFTQDMDDLKDWANGAIDIEAEDVTGPEPIDESNVTSFEKGKKQRRKKQDKPVEQVADGFVPREDIVQVYNEWKDMLPAETISQCFTEATGLKSTKGAQITEDQLNDWVSRMVIAHGQLQATSSAERQAVEDDLPI